MEPPVKKAKTDESKEVKEEPETNAPADSRPKNKDAVTFLTPDTTMNCMPTAFGNMLTALSDGGMQHLLAGARANIGVKAGRYMFETKICELMSVSAISDSVKIPLPRCYCRVGLSTPGSCLILGETSDSVCFDTEGNLIHSKTKTSLGFSFGRDDIVAVLLNLEENSPNFNTISLFKNGERVCQPQSLPESLKGKVLHPTLTFRNMTIHYNFGPMPMAPLSFKSRMLMDAASKDLTVTPSSKPLDGRYEILFPVGLPDEGTFQWLDMFLEKNPQYFELSDRSLLDWAEKSGVPRSKSYQARLSNDKPGMDFQIPSLDDFSVQKFLRNVSNTQHRHYIVMEVKGNLMKNERKDLLGCFQAPGYKTVALVLVGEPPLDFKRKSQELLLHQKQEKCNADFTLKLEAEKKQKEIERKTKELERMKRKAEKEQKKQAEERKRKLDEELKKNLAQFKTDGEAEKEESMEAKQAEDDSGEEPLPDVEMSVSTLEAPKATLTLDEKKLWFKKGPTMDLALSVHATYFTKFSLPDKDEGFDEIRQEWNKGSKCNEYLKTWVQDRKLTTRVEDLNPGEWFTLKNKEWTKLLQTWHTKQNDFKNAVAKKAADKAQKAQLKAQQETRKAVEKAAAEKAALEKAAAAVASGAPPATEEEKKEEEVAKPEEAEEKEEAEEIEEDPIDFDKLDVFGVEDVLNVGGNPAEPLFSRFQFEDWTMMSLRYELNLLCHSFRKDVKDPDRVGIYMEHLPFYYQRYFKKTLNHKYFGFETLKELLDLVRDTVVVNAKNQVVEPQLPEELESQGLYIMLTEEARRDRQRRLDLGDKSAALSLQQGLAGPAAMLMSSMSQNATSKYSPPVGVPPAMTMPVRPPGGAMMPAPMMQAPAAVRPPAWQQAAWKAPGPVRPPAWMGGGKPWDSWDKGGGKGGGYVPAWKAFGAKGP